MAVVSDILLLYTPNGNYIESKYMFFKEISAQRISIGQLLGLLAIPFQIFTVFAVFKTFKVQFTRVSYWFLGFASWSLLMGTVYHFTLGYFGNWLNNFYEINKNRDELLHLLSYNSIFHNFIFTTQLLALLFILGFIISTCLASYLFYKSKQLNWKILAFNPINIYLIAVALYLFFPLLGNVVIVTAFNLGIGVFGLVLLWEQKNRAY